MKCRVRFTVLPAAAGAAAEVSVVVVGFQVEDLEEVEEAVGDDMIACAHCLFCIGEMITGK
jgi:hypothetical protein